MIYKEDDIKFEDLRDWKLFEELCFDLLVKLNFIKLKWRQGGSDKGRDIEGIKSVNHILTETYEEKWFFECKHHTGSINQDDINSKINWADAEKPKHFVIFTSTYITTPGRDWLNKIIDQGKHYKITLIEGKQLKKILLMYPELIKKYFVSEEVKLLNESKVNWIIRDLYMDNYVMEYLSRKLDFIKLSQQDVCFLFVMDAFKSTSFRFKDITDYNFDDALNSLSIPKNKTTILKTLIGKKKITNFTYGFGSVDNSKFQNRVKSEIQCGDVRYLYTYIFNETEGLEFLIESTSELKCLANKVTVDPNAFNNVVGDLITSIKSKI